MKISTIYRCGDRIQNGGWVRGIPGLGDLELKVRGTLSSAYRETEQSAIKRITAENKSSALSADDQDRLTVELCRDALLLDWRNLSGDDGVEIPFSSEAAERLLAHHDFRAFRGGVLWAAETVGHARPEDDAAIAATVEALKPPTAAFRERAPEDRGP